MKKRTKTIVKYCVYRGAKKTKCFNTRAKAGDHISRIIERVSKQYKIKLKSKKEPY